MARALVAWSSGKDSAFALWQARRAGLDIAGILTTVTGDYARVSMHGVREELLDRQAAELGLPCTKVRIPAGCTNERYQAEMGAAMRAARDAGVTQVVFGDLFLADLRAYREKMLAEIGMTGVFPLWLRDTRELAREMIAAGLVAHLVCVDPRHVAPALAGRRFDAALLDELPTAVDPCGENGEFHTCVSAGPMFARAIPVAVGEVVARDGFVFADLSAAAT